MNILYISHSADLYGSEQSLLLLLKNLNQKEFTSFVILPKEGPLREIIEPYAKVEVIPSLKPWLTLHKGLLCFIYNIATIPFILWSTLKIVNFIKTHDIDLVHTNSLVTISGALAAKISNVPHVWHARELLSSSSLYPMNPVLGLKTVIGIIQRLSDIIIANSNATKNCFPNSSNIQVVYNPVDNRFITTSPTKTKLYHELELPSNSLLVGQISQIIPIKGCDIFITAASIVKQHISNVTFISIGGTPTLRQTYKQQLKQMIYDYNLQESFRFLGLRQDIPDILSALDLLVLPSRSESFGRVLVEASAVGIPIIGTNSGGIPEIIDHSVTGFVVPPNRPEILAQAMITLLQNKAVATKMGQKGKERVKSYFTIDKYTNDIENIYHNLAN
ncbi:glycosyltransferase family 4 protein [Anaerolineales bacterium HSG6]|nr:glycosyltransferase family 4 protein [Anaerolineales bacterium HSG6]MDM8531059.1 glycosyltransferase family 4 protein [Anaerolineales bacterium HSG25]